MIGKKESKQNIKEHRLPLKSYNKQCHAHVISLCKPNIDI